MTKKSLAISKKDLILPSVPQDLLGDLRQMIEQARQSIATSINAGLTTLYWQVGMRIRKEILQNERAEYGQKIVVSLARQLSMDYGSGFAEKNLRRMMQFAEVFSDKQIVVSLIRQLSWTHFIALIALKDPIKRDFYAEMCRIERWSVRTLRNKIDSMLYERTVLSKQPEAVARAELEALRSEDRISSDLVFRDPYVLEFLNLNDRYLERDLEDAIMRELEQFLLELGGWILLPCPAKAHHNRQ
jgi:predicted nuclease of restriction endonuclease-like (RecB) superfamily